MLRMQYISSSKCVISLRHTPIAPGRPGCREIIYGDIITRIFDYRGLYARLFDTARKGDFMFIYFHVRSTAFISWTRRQLHSSSFYAFSRWRRRMRLGHSDAATGFDGFAMHNIILHNVWCATFAPRQRSADGFAADDDDTRTDCHGIRSFCLWITCQKLCYMPSPLTRQKRSSVLATTGRWRHDFSPNSCHGRKAN